MTTWLYRLALLAMLVMVGDRADAAVTGPVEYPAVPNCPTGVLDYTASTGVFACVSTMISHIPVVWDSVTTVANATIPLLNPQWAGGGTITSVTYYTNGSSTPSFAAAVKIGGTSVTGCSALTVSSATAATTTCTAANTFTNSSQITLVISSVSGTPNQALVQINYTHTPN
jgi:hypothetical protein